MHKTLALFVGLACSLGLAQEPPLPPPPPPPPVNVPPPAAPTYQPPAPVYPVPRQPPSSQPGLGDTTGANETMRWRYGGGTGLGAFFPGPGVNFGIGEVRGGGQFNNLLGVYAAAGLQLGFGLIPTQTGVVFSGNSMAYVGAVAELTLADIFFVAFGPLLCNGAWGLIDSNGNSLLVAGWMPGATLRVGVGFGNSRGFGVRSQWTLSLAASLYFATERANRIDRVPLTGTFDALYMGFTPMLMFGRDWK